MSQIEEKVKEIIVDKLNCDADQVTPEASFTQDLGADSLDTVELIMELEKAFDTQTHDGLRKGIRYDDPRRRSSDYQDCRRRYQLHRKQASLIPSQQSDHGT